MSDGNQFRKWAAQVARQAGEEPDVAEAQRLLSIAEYWVRLADSEEANHGTDRDKVFRDGDQRQVKNHGAMIFLGYSIFAIALLIAQSISVLFRLEWRLAILHQWLLFHNALKIRASTSAPRPFLAFSTAATPKRFGADRRSFFLPQVSATELQGWRPKWAAS